jgi:hypothetical protein
LRRAPDSPRRSARRSRRADAAVINARKRRPRWRRRSGSRIGCARM